MVKVIVILSRSAMVIGFSPVVDQATKKNRRNQALIPLDAVINIMD